MKIVKNKNFVKQYLSNKNGVTMVALMITIIIILIISGIVVTFALGDNSIIDRAKESSFRTQFREAEKQIRLYQLDKKSKKITSNVKLSNKDTLPIGEKLSETDIENLKSTLRQEIEESSDTDDITQLNLYNIDKNKINIKETYIINVDTMQLYDVKGAKYFGKLHHTLNGEGYEDIPELSPTMDDDGEIILGDDIGWYSPNMNGFSRSNTYLVYYNEEDPIDMIEIPVMEYLEGGKQSSIQKDDKTYVLDKYTDSFWANCKTTSADLEAWWVWIPRYAYYINPETNEMEVIFVDLEDKPIGKKYSALPEGYTVHPAFTPSGEDGSKNLQGIWMGKYETSNIDMASRTQYTDLCYAPDMEGFDEENTYIELFNSETNMFDQEILLSEANLGTINNNKKWYSYSNNIWANIKTVANGMEAWWVWIPRYAYYFNTASKETEIIFIDLNNKPIEKELYGNKLPEGFIVHPAFIPSGEDGRKNLKGIWMGKFEPSYV